MDKELYSKDFYKEFISRAEKSAQEIVPFLLQFINAKSVADLGCGLGIWLNSFKQNGIEKVIGLDGDYVDREMLYISNEEFIPYNLEKPLELNQRFDLAMSLEVAEHIDESCAETFVQNLTSLSDIIFFSAAIPGQKGTNHINEQWRSYWDKLFLGKGYIPVDCLRKHFWNNPDISISYRQNMTFYVKKDKFQNYPKLQAIYENTQYNVADIVHPEIFMDHANAENVYRKKCEELNAKYNKFKLYYETLNRLMKIDQTKWKNYFEKNKISTVTIYGIGEIGKRLFEIICKYIEIVEIIDQNTEQEYNGIQIKGLNQDVVNSDLMIVSAVYDYEKIAENLLTLNYNSPIKSLCNVLDEIDF